MLIISETKLDISFVSALLKFCGYFSSMQLDQGDFDGAIKCFAREIAKLKTFVLNQI